MCVKCNIDVRCNLIYIHVYSTYTITMLTSDLLTPKTDGKALVDEAVLLIADSGIFPDDKCLLKRIALVESKFGTHPDTYRQEYYGGIWQVCEVVYDSPP